VDSTGVQPGHRASDDPRQLPAPNEEVLEAQARVCTGPRQARPLGRFPDDPDPHRILQLILESARGTATAGEVASPIQMGAFFGAMALRRSCDAPARSCRTAGPIGTCRLT
jgi:hypothetical protein